MLNSYPHHYKESPVPECDCMECIINNSWPEATPLERLEKYNEICRAYIDFIVADAQTKMCVKMCMDAIAAIEGKDQAQTEEAVKLCLDKKAAIETKAEEEAKDAQIKEDIQAKFMENLKAATLRRQAADQSKGYPANIEITSPANPLEPMFVPVPMLPTPITSSSVEVPTGPRLPGRAVVPNQYVLISSGWVDTNNAGSLCPFHNKDREGCQFGKCMRRHVCYNCKELGHNVYACKKK